MSLKAGKREAEGHAVSGEKGAIYAKEASEVWTLLRCHGLFCPL